MAFLRVNLSGKKTKTAMRTQTLAMATVKNIFLLPAQKKCDFQYIFQIFFKIHKYFRK